MRQIRIINAFPGTEARSQALLRRARERYGREGLTISVAAPSGEPELETTESLTALSLSVPELIKNAVEAENEGVHGIMVNCMADPGVEEMRESVSIPVLGPGRTSMHVAALLGRRFSLLVTSDFSARYFREQVHKVGLAGSFASCEVVGVPVPEIERDPARTVMALAQAAERAILEAHADTLVLCCTGFAHLAEELQSKLQARNLSVPLVDPFAATINMLVLFIDVGLTPSAIAYPQAPAGNREAAKKTS